jgi:hypothetical protein
MSEGTLDPDVKRERVKADTVRMVVRMADELDEMLKLANWARTALFNELTDGMGYTKVGISDKGIKKLGELAKIFSSMTSAKIQFDKAQKAMADSMSPREEQEAVVAYLKAVEPQVRADIISTIKQWQDRKSDGRTPTAS